MTSIRKISHAIRRTYYNTGSIKSEDAGSYYKKWYVDGTLRVYVPCNQYVPDGEYREWSKRGTLIPYGMYIGGKREGLWTFWTDRGRLVSRDYYKNDQRAGIWDYWATTIVKKYVYT